VCLCARAHTHLCVCVCVYVSRSQQPINSQECVSMCGRKGFFFWKMCVRINVPWYVSAEVASLEVMCVV